MSDKLLVIYLVIIDGFPALARSNILLTHSTSERPFVKHKDLSTAEKALADLPYFRYNFTETLKLYS